MVITTTKDKKYRIEVQQDETGYNGRLQLLDNTTGEEIRGKDVHVAYGAPFGPDVDDVNEWLQQADTWLDEIEGVQQT